MDQNYAALQGTPKTLGGFSHPSSNPLQKINWVKYNLLHTRIKLKFGFIEADIREQMSDCCSIAAAVKPKHPAGSLDEVRDCKWQFYLTLTDNIFVLLTEYQLAAINGSNPSVLAKSSKNFRLLSTESQYPSAIIRLEGRCFFINQLLVVLMNLSCSSFNSGNNSIAAFIILDLYFFITAYAPYLNFRRCLLTVELP